MSFRQIGSATSATSGGAVIGGKRRRVTLRRPILSTREFERKTIGEIMNRTTTRFEPTANGHRIMVPYEDTGGQKEARVTESGTLWRLDSDDRPWILYEERWFKRDGNPAERRLLLIDAHAWNAGSAAVRYEYRRGNGGSASGVAEIIGLVWRLEDNSDWHPLIRI